MEVFCKLTSAPTRKLKGKLKSDRLPGSLKMRKGVKIFRSFLQNTSIFTRKPEKGGKEKSQRF